MMWNKNLIWITIIVYLTMKTLATTAKTDLEKVVQEMIENVAMDDVIEKTIKGKNTSYIYNENTGMKGGYGTVYLGNVNDEGQKQVAIKKIKITANNYEEFQNEVNIMNKLDHKNILEVIEFIDNMPLDSLPDHMHVYNYIVIEYCEGGDLFDRVNNHEYFLPEEIVKEYFKQILDGLIHMHQKEIVHQDLKPENILLVHSDSTDIKIGDFGRSFDCAKNKGNLEGGTLNYMAPEFRKYTQNMDAEFLCDKAKKVDVWSLGVILYIMLTKKYPYFITQIDELKTKQLSSINFLIPNVSIEVKDLVIQMLTFDEEKRITLDGIQAHSWLNEKKNELISIEKTESINPWMVNIATMRIEEVDTLAYQKGVRIGWKIIEYYDQNKNDTVLLNSVNMGEYQTQPGFYTFQKNEFNVGDTVTSIGNITQGGITPYRLNIKQGETFIVTNVHSDGVEITNDERKEPCVVRYTNPNLPYLKKKIIKL